MFLCDSSSKSTLFSCFSRDAKIEGILGEQLTEEDDGGRTVAHLAALSDNTETFKALIEAWKDEGVDYTKTIKRTVCDSCVCVYNLVKETVEPKRVAVSGLALVFDPKFTHQRCLPTRCRVCSGTLTELCPTIFACVGVGYAKCKGQHRKHGASGSSQSRERCDLHSYCGLHGFNSRPGQV